MEHLYPNPKLTPDSSPPVGQALGEAEQARRVERWAALDDAAARARAVAGLPRETLRRVEDLRTTHHILSIQRARRPVTHLPPEPTVLIL